MIRILVVLGVLTIATISLHNAHAGTPAEPRSVVGGDGNVYVCIETDLDLLTAVESTATVEIVMFGGESRKDLLYRAVQTAGRHPTICGQPRKGRIFAQVRWAEFAPKLGEFKYIEAVIRLKGHRVGQTGVNILSAPQICSVLGESPCWKAVPEWE